MSCRTRTDANGARLAAQGINGQRPALTDYFCNNSEMNQPSTLSRAHGVLRRNVRLDLTVGLSWKQRTGMRRPISDQPCRWTS